MPRPVHHAALIAALVIAGLGPLPAAAFGPTGHRLAAYVAQRYLCVETRAALKPFLGGMTLADAGLWPDAIRSEPEWAQTRPWHYLNVSDHGSVARAAAQGPDNVLAALARFEKELADTALDTQRRGLALRFVVHFIVDLHQPLHVGRQSDRGANLIPVLVAGHEMTLHAVWDGGPLHLPGDPGAGEALRWRLPGAAVRRLQQAAPADWARESQALRAEVYAFTRPREGVAALPPAYLERTRITVDRRLIEAGVRLAGRLNSIMGAPPGCVT